jgi:5,10-methylenetetrahydromethanopterin reductase
MRPERGQILLRFHLGFPARSFADLKMPDNAALACLCEERGFDTLWHSNQRFYREMFVRMASSAIATTRLGIGGAVAEPFAVHPALTAQSLASVDELSGGRATLALGAGGSGFEMMGIKRHHSALALREAYAVIKGLLAGQEATFEGEIVRAYQARLQFQLERPTPLWIASRGDLTLETSGEYADGVIVATYATAEGIRSAMLLVEKGARRAGRAVGQMRIMSRVETCVHRDRQTAYEGCRETIVASLWSSYPDRGFVRRTGLEVPAELERLIAKRDYGLVSRAAELLPDEFVKAFCWAGTPEIVADRVIGISQATGIEEYGFWALLAPGQTREESLGLIADEVLPRIRSSIA